MIFELEIKDMNRKVCLYCQKLFKFQKKIVEQTFLFYNYTNFRKYKRTSVPFI